MENFDYFNPVELLFGEGQLDALGDRILPHGRRILFVYGRNHLKADGVYDHIATLLRKAGIEWVDLPGVQPNPRYALVKQGIALCREHDLQFVLGVGGGSVSDTAKAIAVGTPVDYELWDAYLDFNTSMHHPEIAPKHPVGDVLPFGVVMTKAGTGSEFDYTSVLSNAETREKLMIINKSIYAKFAIDDPVLTATLPIEETAFGVADIMTHFLEQYLSPSHNTLVLDRIKEGQIEAVVEAGRKVMEKPGDYNARATLLYAAAWACSDQNMCGAIPEWSSHLIEHEISAATDFNHGHGMAIIYSGWMPYVLESIPWKFAQFAERVWGVERKGRSDIELGQEGIERTKDYWRSLGIDLTFSGSGLDTSIIPYIAERTVRFGKVGSDRNLEKSDIEAILKSVA